MGNGGTYPDDDRDKGSTAANEDETVSDTAWKEKDETVKVGAIAAETQKKKTCHGKQKEEDTYELGMDEAVVETFVQTSDRS